MWANSIEAAFFQAYEWLDLCARNGITLNPNQFQFAQDTVNFAELTLTKTNIRPSTKFLDAISNFPTPTDITGTRAWFGLINQEAYAFAMARQMKTVCALLKPTTTFCWTYELDEVFHKSKEIIIQEMKEGVRLFYPSRMTCLATDWSVDGIGFFLMQKYCQCSNNTPTCCNDGWKLCLVGSRFTHPAESRYAAIEGETLAVVYALHQTRYYVLGCEDLLVATDHKPLLQILNDRSLTDIDNRRLLNLKEKTVWYRFTIIHVRGRKNLGPDAASRYPVGPPDRLNLPGEAPELDSLVNMTAHYHDTLTSLCLHTEDNDTANDTSTVAAKTCALNAVIIVVTWNMVPHQGVSAMRAKAMDSVYWPDITVDISRGRDQCVHCHQMAKSNHMQPQSDITPPAYPFQMICSDYFTYNSNDYVVIVDRAEVAVKTVKRMLVDNITAIGSLDVDKFQRALLMYRNSIDPEMKASPALILFGRPIRDAIPILMVPTPKPATQTIQQPPQIDLDQSYHHIPESDVPAMTKIPRALSRLQPHNKAGGNELLTP
ncbi:unnamed protein product [Mytilus edulis]|uniref:Reverse transcriptase RNase H-like domain-containing protein n=1 Tax=Mytilus edulis TaxID=6550 RepID=A0A8S3QVS3_MYTED|nr:unnamed protein product [Mytilus edulis]